MSLLAIIIAIVVVGVLLWAINAYVPMSAGAKKLLNIVVIAVVVIWLFRGLGGCQYLSSIHT